MFVALVVTNLIFNIFFGLVCGFVAFNFIRNQKKLNQQVNQSKSAKQFNCMLREHAVYYLPAVAH